MPFTVRHFVMEPANSLRASITIRPAITALVVAMAGIMLPAIATGQDGIKALHTFRYTSTMSSHLISKQLFLGMAKTAARKFEAATTKCRSVRESLSQTSSPSSTCLRWSCDILGNRQVYLQNKGETVNRQNVQHLFFLPLRKDLNTSFHSP